MKKTIHQELIEILKFHTPEGENVVDTLININPLSKEAAYRRLRGEIQFTLAETVRIVAQLGISLDKIAGIEKRSQHMFHIKQFFAEDAFDRYYDLLQSSLSVYQRIKKDANASFFFAGNTLPPAFYFKYPLITKYSFFKWFDQMSYLYGSAKQLSEVVIPQKIINIQEQLFQESIALSTTFIIGDEMLLALINDIAYFAAIGLVSDDEMDALKQEIFHMLDDMETLTKQAHFVLTGKPATVYISNAFFDGNYGYLQSDKYQIATLYLYGINQLNCVDPCICENQKTWMQSLIAYSTLISGSGRLSATEFFARKREQVDSIHMQNVMV